MMKPAIHKSRALAFTLVETMVAIAILSIALLVPFYAAQQSLTASNIAKDKLTATMLAEEGVEFVRETRDSDFLAINAGGSNTWLAGIDGSNGSPNCFTNSCAIDPTQLVVEQCTYSNCPGWPLYQNSSDIYTLTASGNTLTKFTRIIQLQNISTIEVKVTATVSWLYHNAPNSTSVSEYLTNWQ